MCQIEPLANLTFIGSRQLSWPVKQGFFNLISSVLATQCCLLLRLGIC